MYGWTEKKNYIEYCRLLYFGLLLHYSVLTLMRDRLNILRYFFFTTWHIQIYVNCEVFFFISLFRCYCLVGQSQNHSILEPVFDNVCKFFQIASHLLNVNNDIWPMGSYTSFNVRWILRATDSETDLQATFILSFRWEEEKREKVISHQKLDLKIYFMKKSLNSKILIKQSN